MPHSVPASRVLKSTLNSLAPSGLHARAEDLDDTARDRFVGLAVSERPLAATYIGIRMLSRVKGLCT